MSNKLRRMGMWWIHWPDLNWPNHDSEELIKRRASEFAEANATTIVDFGTHFRWDYLPYFELLHDYLARVTEECHKYGMEFVDHHSINLVHRYHNREEMRHVMLHSGPHLPFSPSYEAAESWTWNGRKLNDWRMIDVKTGKPLYYPQYASEGFCYRNPEFIESYLEYAQKLVKDTGMDGLMADDAVHYMHYNSCACPACRAELIRRSGIDLPPADDQSFWGNYDNPAWRHWIDLRYDACGEFMEKLKAALPESFEIFHCGGYSTQGSCNSQASDARQFARGANHTNLEISGNTPPYLKDPVTVNRKVEQHLINGLHHEAVAREHGTRTFATGYGFSEPSMNVIWAVSKMSGADCWAGTLKARLGLPDHILATLPHAASLLKKPYTFEKEHESLFKGERVAELGLYFSYETRNHTLFGNKTKGYFQDFSDASKMLFGAGLSCHVLFEFPADAGQYPVVLIPGPLSVTEEEQAALDRYLSAGGKAVIAGPSGFAGTESKWRLPNAANKAPADFFSGVRDGVWSKQAEWVSGEPFEDSADEDRFTEVRPGLWYDPVRIGHTAVQEKTLELCRRFAKKKPVEVIAQQGYLISAFRGNDALTLHFLAAEYDTDVDHELDDMRFHRSRVNYVIRADAVGTSREVVLKGGQKPTVYTPFNDEPSAVAERDGEWVVTLPPACAYAILEFPIR